MPPTSVHFNGSVNLPDAETVMREISARIPTGVRRMTDGETGDRGNWIFFQMQKFAATPGLEPAGAHDQPGEGYDRMPQLRLADGVWSADVHWPDLGYAAAYTESYSTFRALRSAGTIPAGVRFQLQYPTPLASIASWIVPDQQEQLAASYESALLADLDRALEQLPHAEIAVQWDVAVEFGLLVGGFDATGAYGFDAIAASLVRCIDQVPEDVPVGMHLCYGDYGHQHFVQPESLDLQVRVVNAVTQAARRPVSWFSFTVPQAQRDDAYFAPLRDLRTGPDTELDFALVPYHPGKQDAGTTTEQVRRIDEHLAESAAGARGWGVCTECGMGRVDAADVPTLLDRHSEIIA